MLFRSIAEGFSESFADWLMHSTGFPVHIAKANELMQAGRAYVAPNGYQTTVDGAGWIRLTKGDPANGHCPSVSCLFRSVAETYGAHSVGVLLTGMGKDGAAELGLMKAKGAVTIAQDMESAVVYGMPGEAVRQGAATYILTPGKLTAVLVSLASHPPLRPL